MGSKTATQKTSKHTEFKLTKTDILEALNAMIDKIDDVEYLRWAAESLPNMLKFYDELKFYEAGVVE